LINTVVAPLQVSVGDSVDLSTMVSDPAGSLLWTATGGSIDMPSAPAAQYSCASEGTNTITVSLTQAGTSCNDSVSVQVECAPRGPVTPVPADLWQPAAGATPASGNFVYLKGDPGDFIVGARTLNYTQANSILSMDASGVLLTVNVVGDESWSGQFQAMSALTQLEPGYYPDLHLIGGDPGTGGLDWSGHVTCGTVTGWFVVDDVAYDSGALRSIDLRFEQHCESGTPAVRGQIHWSADDPTEPPPPVNPPPEGLWQPAAGATPASGNYVYLQGDANDFIVGAQTLRYTSTDSVLSIDASGTLLTLHVDGDQHWTGDFQGMSSIAELEPGYYPDLQEYPFYNPTKGGLDWYGEGRRCDTVSGWFVVDDVAYANGALSSIDLRFEQDCGGALHGQIHWSADDHTVPPGPVNPPPADLWRPAAGATPATGNYVYLNSDAGDYVGAGQTSTVTSGITLYTDPDLHYLQVRMGSPQLWTGRFGPMTRLDQLELGYYGDLERYGFNNPAKGGLDWSGDGRGCNTLTGWFIVDSVVYTAQAVTAIDLRFEQHCEGAAAALHGAIHYVAP
jgi:hypothetical protein